MQEVWKIFIFAVAIRALFIVIGVILDSCTNGPRYTDVDYNVFSDAATFVSHCQSPYERSTYRYPPIIAMVLVPNVWFGSFGKILFCLADAGCCLELLFSVSALGSTNSVTMAWMWAINLASINICTRGSADSVTNYLVLLLTRLVMQVKHVNSPTTVLAGAIFGALVYLRIYPIIYGPAMLLYFITRTVNEVDKAKRDLVWQMFSVGVKFFVTSGAVLYLLCSLSYYLYGEPYLQNALLYHLSREDHRHNFSVHYLGVYLSKGTGQTYTQLVAGLFGEYCGQLISTAKSCIFDSVEENVAISGLAGLVGSAVAAASSLLLFAPQLLLFGLIVVAYAPHNLPMCLLLQTMVFVAYNKVITAQYFTWYLCLLPLALPSLQQIPLRLALGATVLWLASLAHWLHQAYQLEFEGQNKFVSVWQASLVFHLANVLAIALIVCYAPRRLPTTTVSTMFNM